MTSSPSMVGQLQWAVTLGRYDILAHVMSMSPFRLAPNVGHIERMKESMDTSQGPSTMPFQN